MRCRIPAGRFNDYAVAGDEREKTGLRAGPHAQVREAELTAAPKAFRRNLYAVVRACFAVGKKPISGSDYCDLFFSRLHRSTGALLWSYQTTRAIDASPTVVNGRLYVIGEDLKVYAFGLN
jgi:hypothetical protein